VALQTFRGRRMAAADIVVRPIRADERAEWEPLWKGYQAGRPLFSQVLATLTFSRCGGDKPRKLRAFPLR